MILYPGSPRSYFVGSSDLLRKEVLNRTSAIVFHSRSEVLKRTSARGLFDGPSLLVLACLRTIGIVQFQTCISHQIKWTPSFICCLLIASVSKSPEKYLGGPLRHKTTSTGKQHPPAKREQSWAIVSFRMASYTLLCAISMNLNEGTFFKIAHDQGCD